jgi:DNA-binding protein H-NS
MEKANLSRMNVEALMELRKRVGDALSEQRATIEKQLAALGSSIASLGGKIVRSARGSSLKGKKVAPKYRGPGGELWAGRGATPLWLRAAIKKGKKPESFLIDKSARKGRRKRSRNGN